MDKERRWRFLKKSARFDMCGDCDIAGNKRKRAKGERWNYPLVGPDAVKSFLLKVLMTNHCINKWSYYENSSNRDFERASLSSEEVAKRFSGLYRDGKVRSLFLSSAINESAEKSMVHVAEAMELIRFKYGIKAYIHAKVLPGISDGFLDRAMRLATRTSLNLEVPNAHRMKALGSPKDFEKDLYGRMFYMHRRLKLPSFSMKSQTTQFVIGAAQEQDRELLETVSHLYKDLNLARIYYSAYQAPGRVDFGGARVPLLREHRLYQADFLLRKYGLGYQEITLDKRQNLLLDTDPKSAWVQRHPEFFPLEINEAQAGSLLRVPGLGPVSVKLILANRKTRKITSPFHLVSMGIRKDLALPFLLLDGVHGMKFESASAKQRGLFHNRPF